jgi:hypothetical protein
MPKYELPELTRLEQTKPRPTKKQVVTEASKVPGVMPLDYMLSVIRDPTATQERRDRMAIAAAPYCHPKMADQRLGKKDQEADAATMAGLGTPWAADLEPEVRAN